MNKEKAVAFIKGLFANVWDKLDESKIADYYQKDVVAHFGHQTAHYADIVHRLKYVKSKCNGLNNDVKDVLLDGDKITVYLEQTPENSTKSSMIITIYEVKESKVSRMWSCIDPQINYFE